MIQSIRVDKMFSKIEFNKSRSIELSQYMVGYQCKNIAAVGRFCWQLSKRLISDSEGIFLDCYKIKCFIAIIYRYKIIHSIVEFDMTLISPERILVFLSCCWRQRIPKSLVKELLFLLQKKCIKRCSSSRRNSFMSKLEQWYFYFNDILHFSALDYVW